jgi:hypothetical protein
MWVKYYTTLVLADVHSYSVYIKLGVAHLFWGSYKALIHILNSCQEIIQNEPLTA